MNTPQVPITRDDRDAVRAVVTTWLGNDFYQVSQLLDHPTPAFTPAAVAFIVALVTQAAETEGVDPAVWWADFCTVAATTEESM